NAGLPKRIRRYPSDPILPNPSAAHVLGARSSADEGRGEFSGHLADEKRALAEEVPDIDDRLRLVQLQLAILTMRGTQDQQIALFGQLLRRPEGGVLDVHVGAEDLARLVFEHLAELVRQRLARVVAFSLERHAQDADPETGQRVAPLEM